MIKLLASLIQIITEALHWALSFFVDEETLLTRKIWHLCWWFRKHNLPIPKYFIAGNQPPTVTTSACTDVADTTATANGELVFNGTPDCSVRGFCYMEGTSGDPTTSNDTVNEASAVEEVYDLPLTGLTESTGYRVRAYATNVSGTGYGATVQLTTIATNDPPTVALGLPNDEATGVSLTPDLTFTGTDADSDEVEYNVQVDTATSFDGQGATVDSYSETNYDTDVNVSDDVGIYDVGQSFTGDGNSITSCQFYIKKVSSPTGSIVATLHAHNGTYGTTSTPGAILATSDTINTSTLTTSYQLISFIFPTPYETTNGTKYVIVLNGDFILGDASNYMVAGVDASSPTHDGNYSQFIPTSWSADDTKDLIFYVNYGEPLLDKLSVTPDATFAGTGDPHPWPSGNEVTYTVQAGDTLTASTKYYWRVRAIDPTGSNTYGAWSPGDSTLGYDEFTTTAGGAPPAIKPLRTLLGVGV